MDNIIYYVDMFVILFEEYNVCNLRCIKKKVKMYIYVFDENLFFKFLIWILFIVEKCFVLNVEVVLLVKGKSIILRDIEVKVCLIIVILYFLRV